MFCTTCGSAIEQADDFCRSCGVAIRLQDLEPAVTMVTLRPGERRVPMGSLVDPNESENPIEAEPTSDEVARANAPFDPRMIPAPGALVPANSVWAFWPYPGPFPDRPNEFGRLEQKFVAMGVLVGRTIFEINATVGLPMVNIDRGDHRSTVWGRTSLFSGSWQINLVFDRYGICLKKGAETAF
jgi:hypothetical protein